MTLYITEHDEDESDIKSYLPLGTEVAVGRMLSMPDGSSSALAQGRRRVEILEILEVEPCVRVRAKVVFEEDKKDRHIKALMRTTQSLFENCVELDRTIPDEAHLFALNIEEASWLADMVASAISFSFENRKALFLTTDVLTRLKVVKWVPCSRIRCFAIGRRNSKQSAKVKLTAASENFICENK